MIGLTLHRPGKTRRAGCCRAVRGHYEAGELDCAGQIVIGSGAVANMSYPPAESVFLVRRNREATPAIRAGATDPERVLGAVICEAAAGAVDLNAERVAAQEAGFDDPDRPIRVTERHNGLVFDLASGERGVRSAHGSRKGTQE